MLLGLLILHNFVQGNNTMLLGVLIFTQLLYKGINTMLSGLLILHNFFTRE